MDLGNGDVREFLAHFSRVLDARDRASEGDYCTCATPTRDGSICTACGLCDREFEIEQVLAIVAAHDFEPDDRHPEMCHVCANRRDHHRHRGVSDVGRLRDGTPVEPRGHSQEGEER